MDNFIKIALIFILIVLIFTNKTKENWKMIYAAHYPTSGIWNGGCREDGSWVKPDCYDVDETHLGDILKDLCQYRKFAPKQYYDVLNNCTTILCLKRELMISHGAKQESIRNKISHTLRDDLMNNRESVKISIDFNIFHINASMEHILSNCNNYYNKKIETFGGMPDILVEKRNATNHIQQITNLLKTALDIEKNNIMSILSNVS